MYVINSKEGKEKKGTTKPLNQRPDGAATRGDQSCRARWSELRREWPGLRFRNRWTFSSSIFSSSSIRVFELGFDLYFCLDFRFGALGFWFGLKIRKPTTCFCVNSSRSSNSVTRSRTREFGTSRRVYSEFITSLKKNEFICELTREHCHDSQTRTGVRVNPRVW